MSEDEKENDQEEEKAEKAQLIIYPTGQPRLEQYLKEIFSESELQLKAFRAEDDIFKLLEDPPALMFFYIEGDEITDFHLNLADYFDSTKILIFESIDVLKQSSQILSQNQIYGIAQDLLFEEKLTQMLSKLEFLEEGEEYLTVTPPGLTFEVNISIHVTELKEGSLTIRRPGMDDLGGFISQELKLFLPHFNYLAQFKPEILKMKEDNLNVELDTKELIEQLKVFEHQNTAKVSIAYISDEKPDYAYFSKLNSKVVHYKNVDKYSGEEPLIIIRDKMISPKTTSGTQICHNEAYEENAVLVLNRILPVNKYRQNKIEMTTDKMDVSLIEQFVKDNRIIKNKDSYVFESTNSLTAGTLTTTCELVSLNETYVKILSPFSLDSNCKIQIPFIGSSPLTVLHAERYQTSFLVSLHIDSFSETELNFLRRVIYKIYFLDSKSVDFNQFESAEHISEYEYKEEAEGGADAEETKEDDTSS